MESRADGPAKMRIEELWNQYQKRLRGFIAKRIKDGHSVDDILQATFLKACENLHKVRSEEAMASWLYRIAENVIADHYRGQKHHEELPEELPAAEPARDYAAELADQCISPFIAALPEKYRTALMLADIQGLAQQEVARRLGISLSGAKSRIQRGREKLRDCLNECCDIQTSRLGITGYELRRKNCSCS
ncbi:MAG TPA: RNA polymerase sigma factor SigZ [Gallionella sp.]|nr:RNA polymerase sigma factor SigZ [Gallionella sp.]